MMRLSRCIGLMLLEEQRLEIVMKKWDGFSTDTRSYDEAES